MSVTQLIYKQVDVSAAADATISTSEHVDFSDPSQLTDGLSSPNIAMLELNSWVLNGQKTIKTDDDIVAFWSEELSDEDSSFTNAPVITISFEQQHSAVGLTLVFDTVHNEWCSSVNIKWYQGSTLKADEDFTPDSATYFCNKAVTRFNKIVITISGTSLPYHRAKIEHIVFGVYRTFGMTELRSAKITSQTNLVSAELPISKLNWTLDIDSDVAFMFQAKQPVEVWNGTTLIAVQYIDNAVQRSGRIYEIECADAFGVLNTVDYSGGAFLSGISAQELFSEIVGDDFDVIYDVADTTVKGVIKPCKKREALHQILFAWGCIATTDGQREIYVHPLDDTLASIPESRTYSGTDVIRAALVTSVTVTGHTYTADSSGTIEIGGQRYKDTTAEYVVVNPDVTATDKQNKIIVNNATLISTLNGQATAQRVFDYYSKSNRNRSKIVWQGEKLGDYVTLPTGWGATNTGHIEKMDIVLSNTIAASVESVGA